MSKNIKPILTIILLLLIQVGIYYYVTKNEVEINEKLAKKPKWEQVAEITIADYNILPNGILDLRNKGYLNLSSLPNTIWEDERILTVFLDNNLISEFPYQVLRLPNVKNIQLNNNLIKEVNLEKIAVNSKKLESLGLQKNEIETIKGFEKLPKLKSIDLSYNVLQAIPNLKISSLQYLNLEYNKITAFDFESISPSLTQLNLGNNSLKKFEVDLNDSLKYELRILRLHNNQFRTFPNDVFKIPYLITLDVSNSSIVSWDFPKDMTNKNLRAFTFEKHQLITFDFPLQQAFPHLRFLSIQGNRLKKINIEGALQTLKIIGQKEAVVNINSTVLKELQTRLEYISDYDDTNFPQLLELTIFFKRGETENMESYNALKNRFKNPKIRYTYY